MDRGDIMLGVMMMFFGLLLGTIITALFNLGSRLDELTVEVAKLILCHDHSIKPCQ